MCDDEIGWGPVINGWVRVGEKTTRAVGGDLMGEG